MSLFLMLVISHVAWIFLAKEKIVIESAVSVRIHLNNHCVDDMKKIFINILFIYI